MGNGNKRDKLKIATLHSSFIEFRFHGLLPHPFSELPPLLSGGMTRILCQGKMLKEIGDLRKRIDVPIGEAKRLLMEHDCDVSKAYDEALRMRISPILTETGVSIERATAAFFSSRQDVDRALAKVRFTQNPGKFEKENRPTIEEFLEKLNELRSDCDIYELLDDCEAEEPSEGQQVPDPVATLGRIFTFYSYYQTDTEALLEQEPAVHSNITSALKAVGCSDIAARYSDDVEAGHQKEENFDYLNQNFQSFFDSVHGFCIDKASEIFAWKTRGDREAEQGGGGQTATPSESK